MTINADIRLGDEAVVSLPRLSGVAELVARRRRWLHDMPAQIALKVANRPIVRRALGRGYARSVDAHRARIPTLSTTDAAIVESLERDGIYMTTLDKLGMSGSSELIRDGGYLADTYALEARLRAARGEAFLYVPPSRVVDHPGIFTWGLHDRLLDVAEAYIGLPPAYDGVCINYTVADGREVSTRKWHRDWEDRRMLKVAVYLNDVDADGGPFQMIRRLDTRQSDLDGFTYGLADDRELGTRLGADFRGDIVSCEGPAGTVIFTDTARFFHRGKPATARDRAAVFYSYFANRPRHPFMCERTGMSRRDIAALAEGLPERQRAATLWRRRLPVPLRMIPPALL